MVLNGPHGPPLTEKDTASVLGVSRPTLQRGVERGTIPAPVRIGNLKLYARPVVWALLNGLPLNNAPTAANAQPGE